MGETIAVNRKARHDYTIEDTFEAGLVLRGTEIKSVRAGKVNLQEAYARIERGEAWLVGVHIAPWDSSGVKFNHVPRRDRKLLLHRVQIDQLLGKTKSKGLTLVPLSLYIDDRGKAKIQLGLARGKQLHDRRQDIAERDARRDMERQMADLHTGRR
jgi:SsrA-binding protein